MKLSAILPAFGFILFAYLIWSTGPSKIMGSFMGLDPFCLALGVIATFAILLLKSFKWKVIARLHGIDYPLRESVKVWSVGLFVGIITPGRVGDLIRAFYLNRRHKELGRCLSTVVVDRVIDLSVISIFAVAGMLLFMPWFQESLYAHSILAAVSLYFVALCLMTRKGLVRKLMRPLFRFFAPGKREGLRLSFHDFYRSAGEMMGKKAGVLYVTALTTGIWLFSIFQIQLIAMASGIGVDYLYMLAIMSLVVIIELVPVSVSGIGTREAFLIFALGLAGIGAEVVIAFSILYLVIAYWLNGLIGLLFWIRDPARLKL